MFDLKKGVLCPQCEKGKLDVIVKGLIFNYKARSKKFPNEKIFKCDLCDYEGLAYNENERIEKKLTDFRRCIDGLLSCDNLILIREELGLNKKEMAKLLSINEKTIGRYENGKVTQSEHMDKLYRVLQAFPSAVSVLGPNVKTSNIDFQLNYDPKPVKKYEVVPNEYTAIKESINAG